MTFGLGAIQIAPVAARSADAQAADAHGMAVVMFRCVYAAGDQEPSLMMMPNTTVKTRWLPLAEVIRKLPVDERGPYEALESWARPVLDEHARIAEDTDLSGVWSRDARQRRC